MKNTILSSLLLVSSQSYAACDAPHPTINYLPLGTQSEYCFDRNIKAFANHTYDVKISIGQSKRSLLISPVNSGVFTNVIAFLEDGERVEFNVLTLEKAKVERVEIIKVQD